MIFNHPRPQNYWDNKLIAYFHDPVDKVFRIQQHEDRATQIIETFGIDNPKNKFWKLADQLAAGFERGVVPSYSENKNSNGAIDFSEFPIITHPLTSKECKFNKFKIPDQKDIHLDVLNFLKKQIGMKSGEKGFSENDIFKNKPLEFSQARFFYSHLALRNELAENNIGEIGALWHRIPADSRFPDHSIWHHNSLVSAINSCIELSFGNELSYLGEENDTLKEKAKNQLGLMVFSITPVQAFISKARKLRDYWTGSILLSWLAFEGICWIMENLGPDHILYPSLVDQPLVEEYFTQKWAMDITHALSLKERKTIATFPNKFVFLIPVKYSKDIASAIKERIEREWQSLASKTLNNFCNDNDESKKHLQSLFDRQTKSYWNFQWASNRLTDINDNAALKKLLPLKSFENNIETITLFNKIIEKTQKSYDTSGMSLMYSVSHNLVQSALAASKSNSINIRKPENGQKCNLCGEYEVVHNFEDKDGMPAKTYKEKVAAFWNDLRGKFGNHDFNDKEQLCSICLIKRISYYLLKQEKEHILHESFDNQESFPSTTEIALESYFTRNTFEKSGIKKKDFAQFVHEKEDPEISQTDSITKLTPEESVKIKQFKKAHPITNKDKYYTVLLMDGDNMGKLINGETVEAKWEHTLHPELKTRMDSLNFDKRYSEDWKNIFPKTRLLSPATHGSISESLADFALYSVSSIVKKYNGKLIYAGGDDVCAVFPIDTVLDAASEIQKHYNFYFRTILKDGTISGVNSESQHRDPQLKGKLSVGMGEAKDISISAGILICHHKEPLSQMIERAHRVLEKAKEDGGRNACAIELKKRSGGSRYFVKKWNAKSLFDSSVNIWSSFENLGKNIKSEVSKSLPYKFEELKDAFDTLISKDKEETITASDGLGNLEKFVGYHINHSGLVKEHDKEQRKKEVNILSHDLINICYNNEKKTFHPEAIIIAGFIYGEGAI